MTTGYGQPAYQVKSKMDPSSSSAAPALAAGKADPASIASPDNDGSTTQGDQQRRDPRPSRSEDEFMRGLLRDDSQGAFNLPSWCKSHTVHKLVSSEKLAEHTPT